MKSLIKGAEGAIVRTVEEDEVAPADDGFSLKKDDKKKGGRKK